MLTNYDEAIKSYGHIQYEIVNHIINFYPKCEFVDIVQAPENKAVNIYLEHKQSNVLSRKCPKCGGNHVHVHEKYEIKVKDTPIGAFRSILYITVTRYKCQNPTCKHTFTELPPFVAEGHNITNRMVATVLSLTCQGNMPISSISKILGVHGSIIKEYDETVLSNMYSEVDTSNVKRISIDEISIKKQSTYATLIIDADTNELLYACQGRKKEDVQPFFDMLKERGHHLNIIGASMDRNAGFNSMVKENCPNAVIALDLFHIVKNYNEQVADRVRLDLVDKILDKARDAADAGDKKKAKELKALAKSFKKTKWMLYKGAFRLADEDSKDCGLTALIRENRDLHVITLLSEGLRELWKGNLTPDECLTKLIEWVAMAVRSNINPLVDFAKKLYEDRADILHACELGISNGRLEGLNNLAKVIKRTAYGYRDIEYYFLKLRHAFHLSALTRAEREERRREREEIEECKKIQILHKKFAAHGFDLAEV